MPRIRDRRHRCYELAYEGVMRDPSWHLVHGYFGPLKLGHAWLVRDGQIFCPTLDRVFAEPDYYARHLAVALLTYTAKQAAGQVIRSGHYGPWELGEDLRFRS